MTIPSWLIHAWRNNSALLIVFAPLAACLYIVSQLKKRWQLLRQQITHPKNYSGTIIVVGNITLGGSGKTTFVWWLATKLQQSGYSVAIVSKGYGRTSTLPNAQQATNNPHIFGDEPALLAKLLPNIPVWVGDDRLQILRSAIHTPTQPNFVLCDDGLQDYRFRRFEIALIDDDVALANKKLFPWGILRELPSRLHQAHAIWHQHTITHTKPSYPKGAYFGLKIIGFMHLRDNKKISIQQARMRFHDQNIHMCIGVANTKRVFTMIDALGFSTIHHAFPDHHQYTKKDFHTYNGIILFTPKDAIKCLDFCDERMWQIEVAPWADKSASHTLLTQLDNFLATASADTNTK